tara:strand:+ start:2892 stop:4334 length:1443 start_codon:yes stop_codon:yes gene_type:complete
MDIRTIFKLQINIDELDKIYPNQQECSKIYQTELIIDDKNNNEIQLKVFFDEKEYLWEKVVQWNHINDYNLVDYLQATEIIEPENLLEIDFLNYRCKEIGNSSSFYEFGLQYFTIKLTGIKKTYSNSEKLPSTIHLNQQSFGLIELNYQYNQHFPWSNEEYNWKPTNKIKEYIKFENVAFKPEHKFINSTKNSLEKILIQKEPRLTIEYNDLTELEIKKHIDLICAVYSFYSLENIDYSKSTIHTKDKLHIEIRDVSNRISKDCHGIFRWDFFQNPLNLFINIDVTQLLEDSDFYKKIVERYIYSLNTSGESKFMILYSILEQIRNEYILDKKIEKEKAGDSPNLKKVTEEYSFKLSKTKTDKFIKTTLEDITKIVSEEDKELFRSEIKYKLKPIKVVSMINQFKSLFDYIQIEPKEFDLDFLELKRLRDSVFHGQPISENLEKLNQINLYKCLPKFVGTVILKFSGINDLKNIKRFENQ